MTLEEYTQQIMLLVGLDQIGLDKDPAIKANVLACLKQCIDDAVEAEAADIVLTLKPTSRRIFATHAADPIRESKNNGQADTKAV